MKTNNKKKIVVSVLALAMGAGLAGSISGSVAWYQYSTRTSAAFTGTTAGTSRNLQIALKTSNEQTTSADFTWDQHLNLGYANFRPASVYGTAGSLNFVDHPVYKTAVLPAAVEDANANGVFKKEFTFVFKCDDTTSTGTAQVEKQVFLTQLNIVDKSETTESPARDITPAVRVEIDGANDFIIAATAGTTTTSGELDLNKNNQPDKDGYDTKDVYNKDGGTEGGVITYRNASPTNEDANRGMSYEAKAPTSAVVDATDPYVFENKTGRLLTTTKTGTGVSDPVKVTVWIEGWQQLGGSSIWDSTWMAQNFDLQFQFACEANR